MKKILSLSVCALFALSLMAQENPEKKSGKKEKITITNRANDHFLIQLGYTGWAGIPDTISTSGLSKSINAYFMLDYPFKTNPKLSMAIGAGIGSDHITFTKTAVGIKELTTVFQFADKSDTNHFKKTKLATVYLEAPIELRFSAKPADGNGFKVAVGVKVGMLINAHTRNTKFESTSGTSINDYTMKEASKRFFNKNRLSAMLRIGYGHFSLYGSYQLTTLIKEGAGAQVRPYSVGLTLSGL